MKKITLLIAVIFITGLSFGQQIHNNLRKSLDQQTIVQKNSNTTAVSRNILATLNETFEAIFPPAGWSQTNDWHSTTESGFGIESLATGNTGEFAVFDAYNIAVGLNGSLITPNLAPLSGTAVLSYSVDLVKISTNPAYQGTGAKLYLEVSTNNGVSWTTSTTNVLASLPNYNTATSGWTTQTLSLTAYIGQTVKVRFRAVSDWGWCMPCIDNVTGPNVALPAYDVVANKSFLDFDGFDYYEAIPFDQMGVISYGVSATNAGSSPLTNVTFHVDINSGAYTAASTPLATMASGVTDTLWAQPTIPTPTVFTQYDARYSLTLTETDANPADNIGDSATFYATPFEYLRTMNFTSTLSPYSFGTGAPATTGMEYGANYQLINAAQIDSIEVYVYDAAGTPSITGKLYSIDVTGARTLVGQTATVALVPANLPAFMVLPLTTPYVAAAGTLVTATIAMTTVIGTDTVDIGADGSFIGDASMAGAAYLYVSGAWDWYSVTGTCPIVGIDENICSLYTTNITPTSSSICSGTSTTLTADAAISYAWASNPAGFTSTLQSPVVTPTQTTVYTVTTTNASGCTDTDNITITVNPAPTAYTVTGSGSYCSGGTGLPVGLSSSQTGVNYQLQANAVNTGSPIAGTGSAISFGNQTSAGTYTVIATNATTSCTNNMTGNAVITISTTPVAFIASGTTAICSGSSTTITLSGSATGVNYQLYNNAVALGSAIPGTGSALTFNNITAVGTYTIVGSAGTCTTNMTGNAIITVNQSPTANAGTDQSIATGSSTTLAGSASGGTGPYNYAWTPSGSLVSANVQNPTTTSLTVTTTYTVVITDQANGCTGSDQVIVTVTGGALSATCPAASGPICQGSSVPITTNVSGGTNPYSYLWTATPTDPTLTSQNTLPSPVVTPTVNTVYTVVITDGALNSVSCSVSINVDPTMATSASATDATCGSSDGSATVSVTSGGTPTFNYVWNSSPTQTTATATGLPQGTYNVTVSDASGCTTTNTATVNCVTGTTEYSNSANFSIVPNPSNGSFSMVLRGYNGKATNVSIFDLKGQLLFNDNWTVNNDVYVQKVNVENLDKGVYYIRLVTKGSIKTVKLVIE